MTAPVGAQGLLCGMAEQGGAVLEERGTRLHVGRGSWRPRAVKDRRSVGTGAAGRAWCSLGPFPAATGCGDWAAPASPLPLLLAQGHLLPGVPVHQVWRGGAQGVSRSDASLQDQ